MLVKVSLIDPVPELEPSLIPVTAALDQLIVPTGLLTGVYVNIPLEHIAGKVSVPVSCGKGSTTKVTVSVFSHP